MRVEPYDIGSVVHVIKRGTRGTPITKDAADKRRFVRLLYYLNDEFQNRGGDGWEKEVRALPPFARPPSWPQQRSLTNILAWTLMPNHFHLILQETKEGGISKFMQRLGGSMSTHYNAKYSEQGSLFQSAFRLRIIDTDEYLRYCTAYVMVKNTFELAPGGLAKAAGNFEDAWRWALTYPYSSLPYYGSDASSVIIKGEDNILKEVFVSAKEFKRDAKDMFLAYSERRSEQFADIILENW